MQFWVSLFTVTSWQEAKSREKFLVGFNNNQKKLAAQIKVGDLLLAYLTKVSRFIAVLKVTKKAQSFDDEMWSEGLFPTRVEVEILDELSVEKSIPVSALIGKLSFLQNEDDYKSARWSIHIRSSPRRWSAENGNAVWGLIKDPSDFPQTLKTSSTPEQNSNRRPRGFQNRNLIKSVSRRTKSIEKNNLKHSGKIFSTSKVTGYAVNFPIYKTCRPTEVCMKTCYFAVGLNTSKSAISHQLQNYWDCIEDPEGFSERVIREYDNLGLTFLRWNGGGDLFEEAVTAINFIGKKRPDIVLWIVSRIPELASQLTNFPNHFIHISLDRSTIEKKGEFSKLFKNPNQFFSYQVHPEETLERETVKNSSLIFMHDYGKIPTEYVEVSDKFCPLNGADNLDNTCENCRRCFK